MRLGRIQNNYTKEGFDEVLAQELSFIEICCNYDENGENLINSVESVKSEIERTKIPVSAVGRWNHHLQKDGIVDKNNEVLYHRLLDSAIDLGAKSFVCGINYDDSITFYKNCTNAINFFGGLIERAAGKIKIAVQNCHWNNFVLSPREWEVIMPELPDLCIKYDPSHAYNRDADYLSELSEWGERVAHVHLKGTVHAGKRKVSDPPAGMDDIAWGSVMATLYSIGYDGDLSIEPHSAAWQGERACGGILYTRDYFRKFII